MIPLTIFLIIWLVLIGIYALLSLISMIQMIRFGVMGSMTYFSTALFVVVAALALGLTALYLINVDWSQSLNLATLLSPSTNFLQ